MRHGQVRSGFHILWDTPCSCNLLQATRESYIGGQQRLAGSGPQPAEDTVEVGKADAGVEQGGGGCPDLGTDILGGDSVGNVVRVRDVGDDAAHQEGVGRITPQYGTQYVREATLEREGRIVDIPPAGGRNGGSTAAGVGYLRLPPPEHGYIVHCKQDHYGPVS